MQRPSHEAPVHREEAGRVHSVRIVFGKFTHLHGVESSHGVPRSRVVRDCACTVRARVVREFDIEKDINLGNGLQRGYDML